jgi:hypothetical protein
VDNDMKLFFQFSAESPVGTLRQNQINWQGVNNCLQNRWIFYFPLWMSNSTRLFFIRPSSVVFSTRGLSLPKPTAGQNDVGILDPASPTEIKITPLSELPENDPARYQFERWTIKDKVTGKEAQLPGIRPLTSVDDRHIQSNFLIAYYFNEGFYIYDLKQKRTINEKAIYPGWMNDERVVFMPGINKLLVWTLVPVFTRPNATDQDPGASAFTIDIVYG